MSSDRKSPNVFSGIAAMLQFVTGPWNRENMMSWLKLAAFFLVFSWLGFQQFSIPSGSMEPTLHGATGFFEGDRIWVNKWWYGPRVPFMNKRIFKGAEPQRWDIVVFNASEENSKHGILIKRIVGLPGERIQVLEGKIFADGIAQTLPESMPDIEYTRHLGFPEEAVTRQMDLLDEKERDLAARFPEYKEQLEKRIRKFFQDRINEEAPARYGILTDDEFSIVPEGHYLVMGDNSPASRDGRVFGWLPEDNILGRATCTWWPINRRHDFTGWTHTWFGALALYGLPLLFIAYKLFDSIVASAFRVRDDVPGSNFKKGSKVWVNRLATGIRIPMTKIRLTSGRKLRSGEIVVYANTDYDDVHQLCLGRIDSEIEGASGVTAYRVAGDGEKLNTLKRKDVIGVIHRKKGS